MSRPSMAETATRPEPVVSTVVAEAAGAALVLRTAGEPAAPLHDFAATLPEEEGRVAVVCSPAAGVATTLPDVLADALGGRVPAVRLVMLGPFPGPSSALAAVHYLVQLLGVPVTAPQSPVVIGELPGPAWMTSRPNQATRYEPPWPLPEATTPGTVQASVPVPAPEPVSAEALAVALALAPPAEPAPAPDSAPDPALAPVAVPAPIAVSSEIVVMLARTVWPECGPVAAGPDHPPAIPIPTPAEQSEPPSGPPAVAGEKVASMAPAAERTERATTPPPARWTTPGAWRAEDRAELRTALNGRYDVHSRVVARTLAEEPGLRAAGALPDLVAGLVALRAYTMGERHEVNRLLRTGVADSERVAVIARGAAHGLTHLPTVLGPVFRPARVTASALAGYQPGQVLVEPGFLDVRVTPAGAADAVVEFVIWSVTARRVGRLGAEGEDTAIFPPATRFAVLALDPPSRPAEKPRVLLCDVAGGDRGGPVGGNSDRVLARLRETPRQSGDGAPAYPDGLPGLDDAGQPYPASSR